MSDRRNDNQSQPSPTDPSAMSDIAERKEETTSVSESENPGDPGTDVKSTRPRTNRDWWPNQLDLTVLHQHSPRANPDPDFDYAPSSRRSTSRR
jgi:catalase-peroxidase